MNRMLQFALASIFGPLALREAAQSLPDNRLNPYGGTWDARVPNRPGDEDELTARDNAVPLAADILAPGARSRDVTEPSITVTYTNTAIINSSSRLVPGDIKLMNRVIRSGGSDRIDKAALLARRAAIIARRRQSVAITRGLLKAGMVLGEFSYSRLGVKSGTIDFGMPASLKIVPSTFWYGANRAPNAAATPIRDMKAADIEADRLGGAPFDAIEISQAGFLALCATTEILNAIRLSQGIQNGNTIPTYQQGDLEEIVGKILKKTIFVTENRYNWQDEAGATLTGRYTPENYAILFRIADVGKLDNWEFIDTVLTQSEIAALGGSDAFGGEVVRGPFEFVTYDHEEFAWVRMHSVEEGLPNRVNRTVTARIKIANSEDGN